MIYTFKNNDTGEVFEKHMRMAEKEPYLEANPHLSSVITAANISYSGHRSTISQTDDTFNDVMKGIKKASGSGCTIETK